MSIWYIILGIILLTADLQVTHTYTDGSHKTWSMKFIFVFFGILSIMKGIDAF